MITHLIYNSSQGGHVLKYIFILLISYLNGMCKAVKQE